MSALIICEGFIQAYGVCCTAGYLTYFMTAAVLATELHGSLHATHIAELWSQSAAAAWVFNLILMQTPKPRENQRRGRYVLA